MNGADRAFVVAIYAIMATFLFVVAVQMMSAGPVWFGPLRAVLAGH